MEALLRTDRLGGSETDTELATRLARGDDRALAEVYRRHAPQVLAVANAVLQDQSAAEDVSHDVFVNLARQPLRFDSGRGSLGTYLVALAHGRALDRLRFEQGWASEKRGVRFASSTSEDAGDHPVTPPLATQIWAAVSTLPADEAEALRLAYFGGATYWEVARILDLAEGTVKSRIRSGLRRLRAEFVEQGIIGAA